MADSIIITSNVTDGAVITSNVSEATVVTANVVTGAKGDKGDKGDVGTTDYNELVNTPDLTLKADQATTYTKIEVDTSLAGKAELVHVHAISDVTGLQTALDGKSATGHTHTAANVTDFDTEVSNNTDVAANTAARHTHANKTLLDTYSQTEVNIADAVAKKHTHANSAVLNATTASFTTADETKLDGIAAGAQVNTVTSVNARTGAVTGLAEASDLTAHTGNTSNPHSVTKAQVGLGNVNDTSDTNKPVSTATQTALNGKFTQRTITGTTNQITVTNGDGVSGNPTLSLPQDIHTGASPTFAGGTINGKLNITTTGINTVLGTSTSVTGEANIDVTHLGTSSDQNRIKINHYSRNSAGTMLLNSQIQARLSSTTAGAEVSQFAIQGYTAGVYGVVFNIDYGNIYNVGSISPRTNLYYSVGSTANYWANVYANKLFLNSTATLDGSTAGKITFTGNLAAASNYGSDLGTSGGAFSTVRAGVFRADYSVGLAFSDASNIQFGTVTGTKIGTAATQKLGFYNATPVVQPSATPANATDLATALTLVNDLKSKLVTLGLIA